MYVSTISTDTIIHLAKRTRLQKSKEEQAMSFDSMHHIFQKSLAFDNSSLDIHTMDCMTREKLK